MSRYLRLYISFLFAVFVVLPFPALASWQPEITIGIMQGASSVQFSATGGTLYVYENPEKHPIFVLPQRKELDVRILQGKILANGQEIKGDRLVIQPEPEKFIKVNGMPYRGYITLLKRSGLTVVNNVLVEDYLYGVVPKEMPSSWSMEALRAQSVAETKLTTEAVNRTRGEVLFYKGTIIDALFHTDSGGMTESSENVWGSSVPYLRAVNEVQSQTKPWSRTVSMDVAVKSFEKNGKRVGLLREVRLSRLNIGKGSGDRSLSGRVRSADFVGTKGHALLSGNELRSMFSLPSTLFDVRLSKTGIVFSGYGSGHGLGLSQWGAKALADQRESYKDILFHYYTGVTLEKLY